MPFKQAWFLQGLVVVGLAVNGLASSSCTSACGLGLVRRLVFSRDPTFPLDPPTLLASGAFLYQDI